MSCSLLCCNHVLQRSYVKKTDQAANQVEILKRATCWKRNPEAKGTSESLGYSILFFVVKEYDSRDDRWLDISSTSELWYEIILAFWMTLEKHNSVYMVTIGLLIKHI
ncbi:predicted protein [Botrytis cinerea T4]|uniref:Uncharacterized protein n=1 Tax=Botryotinia fuckeliana (strain T4) TaxID=999810 RepID=G2YUH6_BOTF4|nr:predicted protein [Botrytis cinerea T4]